MLSCLASFPFPLAVGYLRLLSDVYPTTCSSVADLVMRVRPNTLRPWSFHWSWVVASTEGTFELESRAAYFNSDYWGTASYADGNIDFATRGYIPGAGGYSYYYFGVAYY